MKIKICKRCGKEIPFAARNTKYCVACRQQNKKDGVAKWTKKNRPVKKHICIVCGKEIGKEEKQKKICLKCRDDVLRKIEVGKAMRPSDLHNCVICGAKINTGNQAKRKYCPDCNKLINLVSTKHNETQKRIYQTKEKDDDLGKIIKAAKEAGMSYGKYVAMRRMEHDKQTISRACKQCARAAI